MYPYNSIHVDTRGVFPIFSRLPPVPDLQMSDLAFADDAERLLLVDDLPEEDAKDGASLEIKAVKAVRMTMIKQKDTVN